MSFKHISGWVNVTSPEGPEGPVDPGYDRPSYGGRPDNSLPGSGGRPDNSLPGGSGGHIWGALIRWAQRPHIDNDPSKPPGRPIIPDNSLPPNGGRPPHAGWPGHWEPIDPGFGKPPLWGFVPGIDNGLPTQPGRPDNTLPGGGGGNWVPTDPDYGKPGCPPCPGGKPHPPIWAWIPDRPDIKPPTGGGGKPTPSPTTTTIYPSTVTTLASGGSGSVNVTTDPAGSWTVDAASVPDWVTLSPMSSETSDKNCVYSVTANDTGVPKQAFIKINDATLTINQGAV